MKRTKDGDYKYRGQLIEACYCEKARGQHPYKWFVRAHHHTGIMMDEGCCQHYYSLQAAKEDIDYFLSI